MRPGRHILLLCSLLVACGSTPESSAIPAPVPPETSTEDQAAVACDALTPIVEPEHGGLPEVQGVAEGVTIFGLLFPQQPPPIRVGELKIVWRVTGTGDLSVTYVGPSGAQPALTFGPQWHDSSSFRKPGDEWGTGFLFDEPGCWRIHLARDDGSGTVWINVVD